jgi:uncharacterized protein YbjQ (UPF0145 family)
MDNQRLRITDMQPGGLAESCGLMLGDIIESYAGVIVDCNDNLLKAISSNTSGADLIYIRNNRREKIIIPPGRLGLTTISWAIDVNFLAETELVKSRTPSISIISTTAPAIEGKTISEIIGIVGSECVYGAGPLKDTFAGVRDLVGGRSKTVEKLISDARNSALNELKIKASEAGADALISVSFQISNISNTSTMIMVSATGTAVKLNPVC